MQTAGYYPKRRKMSMKSPLLSPKLRSPKSAAYLETLTPNQNHLKYMNFSTKGIPTKVE